MFIKTVIDAMEQAHVRYVMVGGYAVALHGAVRGTVDLDFVIALQVEQFIALEKALLSIGLTPLLPVSAEEVFHFRQEYIQRRNLVAWSFMNPDNPLELVDIIITHNADTLDTLYKRVDGITMPIPIASIDELIEMKQVSARAQDLEDIKALERLR